MDELEPALDRLDSMNLRIKELQLLDSIVPKFETLDTALKRLSDLNVREVALTPVVVEEKPRSIQGEDWARLKQLSKFVELTGKAREIELEWQKIQQDEHDTFFAFQVMKGHGETEYAYKKGISDGVKWCVERFS